MNKISPFVGVLMLDTAFARLPGDAGATESYPFPTKINRVQGAGSLDVVHGAGPSDFLLSRFVNAAQELEAEGAVGLVSTCGFLVHSQKEIAASVGIPTVLSALSLYPSLRLAIGERPIGILTASERYLMNGTLIMDRNPDVGCFLLECGNLPPYAKSIGVAVQRPMFSILDAADLIWAGSERGQF